mmetsp:Transcript_17078/g.41036  ORF Transcript_17078/g.41036 Transcript_17078/m.41036 type:complete len:87 (+) Transcript_17078:720-980(+)
MYTARQLHWRQPVGRCGSPSLTWHESSEREDTGGGKKQRVDKHKKKVKADNKGGGRALREESDDEGHPLDADGGMDGWMVVLLFVY